MDLTLTHLCNHLLGTKNLNIQQIAVEDSIISIDLESSAKKSVCPKCGQESTATHSHYMRYPADLAWADRAIVFNLKVKRFFCRNKECPKRTFAEQFPEVVRPYARQTNRVLEKQLRIGLNTSACTAEKLLDAEQIGISDSTVNQMVRDLPDPEAQPVRVLGVDDWAKRKGQKYGTILVDLERARIVDLLNDRTSETLAKWLKQHPEVEIVSRDRSQTYAEGIADGAPNAVQVADRWHLLKNLSDAIFKILQQEYAVIKMRLAQSQEDDLLENADDEKTGAIETPLTQAEERRSDRMTAAQDLSKQGWTNKRIAEHLDIHPKTVSRYIQSTSPKSNRMHGKHLLDPVRPYLLKRWNEGCHNAALLYREIKIQGFAGKYSIVLIFAKQLRKASGLLPKVRNQAGKPVNAAMAQNPPSLRKLASLVIKRPENRMAEDEKLLKLLSSEQPKLIATIELARTFAEITRQQQAAKLDLWLEQAEKSGYRVWRNFASGIKQDYKAVYSALSLTWSNGPTEGHVNRLKYLKRQMYGRGKEDLLRKRALLQGRWPFT